MRVLPVEGENEIGATLKRADFDHDDEEEESCRGEGGEDIEAGKPIFSPADNESGKKINRREGERESGPRYGLMGPMGLHLTHCNMVWDNYGSLYKAETVLFGHC